MFDGIEKQNFMEFNCELSGCGWGSIMEHVTGCVTLRQHGNNILDWCHLSVATSFIMTGKLALFLIMFLVLQIFSFITRRSK